MFTGGEMLRLLWLCFFFFSFPHLEERQSGFLGSAAIATERERAQKNPHTPRKVYSICVRSLNFKRRLLDGTHAKGGGEMRRSLVGHIKTWWHLGFLSGGKVPVLGNTLAVTPEYDMWHNGGELTVVCRSWTHTLYMTLHLGESLQTYLRSVNTRVNKRYQTNCFFFFVLGRSPNSTLGHATKAKCRFNMFCATRSIALFSSSLTPHKLWSDH